MIIGLISDTHIPDRLPKLPNKVMEAFKGVDLILHAGDLTSKEIITKLEKIAPVIAIEGNMDRYSKLNLEKRKIIKEEGIKVGLIHGEVYPRGDSQQLYYLAKEIQVDVLVSGHSHQPKIEKINDVLLINPGSPTVPRFADATVMLLELNNGNIDVKVVKIGGPVCSALNLEK